MVSGENVKRYEYLSSAINNTKSIIQSYVEDKYAYLKMATKNYNKEKLLMI
jgi:hypothetical protein